MGLSCKPEPKKPDLICTYSECESRDSDGGEPMFTAPITVYDNYGVAETIQDIPPQLFVCCYCASEARHRMEGDE